MRSLNITGPWLELETLRDPVQLGRLCEIANGKLCSILESESIFALEFSVEQNPDAAGVARINMKALLNAKP